MYGKTAGVKITSLWGEMARRINLAVASRDFLISERNTSVVIGNCYTKSHIAEKATKNNSQLREGFTFTWKRRKCIIYII